MTAKIVEVLAKILEGINLNNYSLDKINKDLVKSNEFDKQTVSAAFSLIYDKVLIKKFASRTLDNLENKNFRVFTDEEISVLGNDNLNYIMYLLNVGLVNPVDIEMILEQVLLYPGEEVTRDDINWIIFVSLVDFNMEVLPGSRVLLYSSDKIN